MPRYKLTIEYDGGPYAGFQRQDGPPTVQGVLEAAVLAFAGEEVTLKAAGRTDTGVHATGQVVHVDLAKDWPTDTVRDAMNAHIRRELVGVLTVEQVDESFDARFSATKRHYCYTILNRRPQPVLERGQVWGVAKPLDESAMQAAADRLIGHHDFTTFRSVQCQANSPMRTLDRLDVTREGEHVFIDAAARSFLHNQVRSLVGALKQAGEGRLTPDEVQAMLEARDRHACAPVAPAHGLVFTKVEY
ncbi:MAG: tRNA pseudouridine(38-40) synthase TruA [Rhizobiales bacterium]|nr:tRNA pseudouridine(38-40) synthase TruA [Hyphomicrobiales bacterium]MBO6700594.1 tRNA pseudouridine(38-40) synthase TruA [Hyphomicrobiales bacterium]MBO6738130.1 tRNA pseudouridine(38-40) synthase TruA [Hyphomicrobiales bacterium]MBO6913563.1 tRNA pseudouridine(38-40) synthase TruA [Hyphomicrobiales bacterium]MBO6955268.1 tRNA pseudouridine(38-40) synthase TruA [Hyphomicrobiales bacterium]